MHDTIYPRSILDIRKFPVEAGTRQRKPGTGKQGNFIITKRVGNRQASSTIDFSAGIYYFGIESDSRSLHERKRHI